MDSRKSIKTVVWTRIDQSVFDDNKTRTFENVSVCTGPRPRALKLDFHRRVIFACVVKMEEVYERSRVNVKFVRGSTYFSKIHSKSLHSVK